MREVVLFKKGLRILDSVLNGLRKRMEEKHRLMQIASNRVNKAENYLASLEGNVSPQIARLKREFKSDQSKMINYYKNSVESHISNKKRDARVCSREGAKFKRKAADEEISIQKLSCKLESAKKSVKGFKKKEKIATEAYNNARSEYMARKEFIESLKSIKNDSGELIEVVTN